MAIRLERSDLVSALSAVARVIENRNTIPVLANVHLSVVDNRLVVRGTDLDIEITTSVPADGELGTTTAPARTLLDIAKKFPSGAEITLELDDQTLVVKSGRSRFKLGILPADGFPTLKAGEFGADFEVDLDAAFAPVRFAISSDTSRYHLNGIYLHGQVNQLTAVATDGHRLGKHIIPAGGTPWPDFDAIIVPTKMVGVVPQGVVSVAVSSEKIRLTQGNTVIISKLIEATYPDFERVIPKRNEHIVTVDRGSLLGAVDRVATVASERSGKVVKFEVAGDVITLTVRADHDSASDEVAAEYVGDAAIESGMNARYLQDILGVIGGDKVTLAFGDPTSPILVRGDNDNWTGVQMPMRA